jgi:hypothetical protein
MAKQRQPPLRAKKISFKAIKMINTMTSIAADGEMIALERDLLPQPEKGGNRGHKKKIGNNCDFRWASRRSIFPCC